MNSSNFIELFLSYDCFCKKKSNRAMTSLALEKSVEIALDSLYDEMVAEAENGGDVLASAPLKNNRYPDEVRKSSTLLLFP